MKHMPEGWRWVRLEDVFQRIQRTIKTDVENVLSITARVGFVDQAEKFGRVIAGKNLERYILLRHGEFAYNKGNSNSYPQGCIYMLEEFEQGAVPNVYYCFRATSSEVCTEFYKFYFESGALNSQLRRLINSGVRNDGLLNLPADHFFRVRIPLPPIDEQRRIAEVLRDADANIARVEAQIEAAQAVKRGVMQRLFTYGLAGDGAPTKETDTGKIPEHWSIEPLKKHTESSAFGPRFPGDAYADNGNIATLRTTDLDENGFINYEAMPRATLNEMRFASHILQRGDLTITRSGTIGIVSVFDSYRLPVVPGAFLIRFRLFDTVLPDFLRQYLNSDIGRRRVLGIAAGGVQKNLQGSAMLRLKIPVPPIEEQREIAAILNTHDATIRNLQAEAASLRDVKRGLMQKLLSGQIRI